MPNVKVAPRSSRPPQPQAERQNTNSSQPPRPAQQAARRANNGDGSNGHTANGPTDKVSTFPVEAAIWLNYSQDGKPMYSVTFQRVYKAHDGSWKRTQGYAGSDLLILSQVALGAWNRIQKLKQVDARTSQQQTQQDRYEAVDDDVPF